MTTLRAWAVAVLLGAIAAGATAVLLLTTSLQSGPPGPPRIDRVDTAVSALRTSPLYVAPEMASRLDADQRRDVVATLRKSPVPTYVVVWSEKGEPGYRIPAQAAEAILGELGDGRVVLVDESSVPTMETAGEGYVSEDRELLGGRLDQGLQRYLTALAAEPAESESESGDSDYWGGAGGGLAAGALFGSVGFLALWGLVLVAAPITRVVRST